MLIKILLTLLFFVFSVNACPQSLKHFLQESHIDSMLVKYTDFDMLTMVDIDCDQFEKMAAYDEVMVTDTCCISKLTSRLSQVVLSSSGIDVRCKVYLYTDNEVNVICLGNRALSFEGNVYRVEESFDDLVKEWALKGHKVSKTITKDESPVLLTNRGLFSQRLRDCCLPIMSHSGIDSLALYVDLYVDRRGNAIDIEVKSRGTEIPEPLRLEIIRLFEVEFKWTASEIRPPKVHKVFPICLKLGD